MRKIVPEGNKLTFLSLFYLIPSSFERAPVNSYDSLRKPLVNGCSIIFIDSSLLFARSYGLLIDILSVFRFMRDLVFVGGSSLCLENGVYRLKFLLS